MKSIQQEVLKQPNGNGKEATKGTVELADSNIGNQEPSNKYNYNVTIAY